MVDWIAGDWIPKGAQRHQALASALAPCLASQALRSQALVCCFCLLPGLPPSRLPATSHRVTLPHTAIPVYGHMESLCHLCLNTPFPSACRASPSCTWRILGWKEYRSSLDDYLRHLVLKAEAGVRFGLSHVQDTQDSSLLILSPSAWAEAPL
jgi:hypothetical protein